MSKPLISLTCLLFFSTAVLAETSLLEATGKQLIKNTATQAAPEAVKSLDEANQTLENAKSLQQNLKQIPETSPSQLQESLKKSAEQSLQNASPEQIKQGKQVIDSTKQLKATAKSPEKAVKNLKNQTKQKAAEKTLELLR